MNHKRLRIIATGLFLSLAWISAATPQGLKSLQYQSSGTSQFALSVTTNCAADQKRIWSGLCRCVGDGRRPADR